MSSSSTVGRTLYREILRWAQRAEGIPLRLRPVQATTVLSEYGGSESFTPCSADHIAEEVKYLTRHRFRETVQLQGDEAENGLDKAFQALKLLNTEYTPKLQHMQQQRAIHTTKEGVAFSVGQVIKHRKYGYRGVVYGWDHTCAHPPLWASQYGVRHAQPFFQVLPDEDDCQRLFGSTRMSKYVAQENIECVQDSRVLHRALDNFFTGYSPSHGRYIPQPALQYEYPDDYHAWEIQPIGNDSNVLGSSEHHATASTAVKRKHLLIDVG